MGFRNFLGRIGDNLAQTEKETPTGNREEINRMKGLDIYQNNPYVKVILDIGVQLEKVTFGTRFLPNVDSVYRNLDISDRNEVIIATVRSKDVAGGLFSKERIAITDKALYCHCTAQKRARFLLEDLSKYIVIINEDGTLVDLMDEDGRHAIMTRLITLSSKDKAEQSVVTLIKAIQKYIIENTDYGKTDRKKLCDWLVASVEKMIEGEKASDDDDRIMKSLESMLATDAEQRTILSKCLLKYSIRLCDIDSIQNNINKLLCGLSDSEQQQLLDLFFDEFKAFESELQDCMKDYTSSYLEKALKNLNHLLKEGNIEEIEDSVSGASVIKEVLNHFAKRGKTIKQYLLVRGDLSYNFFDLHSEENISRFQSREEADKFFLFACEYKNRRMAKVFEKVKNGENPSKEQMQWVDGFGFNALHYAIMLRQNNVVDELVGKFDLINKIPSKVSNEISSLYDYGTIALIIGENEQATNLVKLSDDIRPLISNIKTLRVLLKMKQAAFELSKKGLAQQQDIYRRVRNSDQYDPIKVDELANSIEELREKINTYEDEIRDLKRDIFETEQEIESCARVLLNKYKEEAARIKNASGSLEWFFSYIFNNPEEYYSIISKGYFEGQVIFFHGIAYDIPLEFIKKMGYSSAENNHAESEKQEEQKGQKEQKKQKKRREFKKPHGNHWFSDAAYADIKIMRKEYRILATQYHPDNNPDGVEAFLEIQEEKAVILERFKDAA